MGAACARRVEHREAGAVIPLHDDDGVVAQRRGDRGDEPIDLALGADHLLQVQGVAPGRALRARS
jgi:hypothetical protein